MPMVRHHAVRKQRDIVTRDSVLEDADERFVIVRIVEKSNSFCGSIQDVEDQSRRAESSSARHANVNGNENAAFDPTGVLIK